MFSFKKGDAIANLISLTFLYRNGCKIFWLLGLSLFFLSTTVVSADQISDAASTLRREAAQYRDSSNENIKKGEDFIEKCYSLKRKVDCDNVNDTSSCDAAQGYIDTAISYMKRFIRKTKLFHSVMYDVANDIWIGASDNARIEYLQKTAKKTQRAIDNYNSETHNFNDAVDSYNKAINLLKRL